MTEDNNNDRPTIDSDFSDSDDLLYSLTYAIRKITLSNWEDALIGVILEEEEDSFLLAMPAKIITIEGSIFLKPIDTGCDPFIRLLKSGIRAIASPPEIPENLYIEFISNKAPQDFPELLSMVGLQEYEEMEIEGEFKPVEGIEGNPPPPPKKDTSLKGATLINAKGVTNEEVDAKVKKAQAEGVFFNGNTDKKLAN